MFYANANAGLHQRSPSAGSPRAGGSPREGAGRAGSPRGVPGRGQSYTAQQQSAQQYRQPPLQYAASTPVRRGSTSSAGGYAAGSDSKYKKRSSGSMSIGIKEMTILCCAVTCILTVTCGVVFGIAWPYFTSSMEGFDDDVMDSAMHEAAYEGILAEELMTHVSLRALSAPPHTPPPPLRARFSAPRSHSPTLRRIAPPLAPQLQSDENLAEEYHAVYGMVMSELSDLRKRLDDEMPGHAKGKVTLALDQLLKDVGDPMGELATGLSGYAEQSHAKEKELRRDMTQRSRMRDKLDQNGMNRKQRHEADRELYRKLLNDLQAASNAIISMKVRSPFLLFALSCLLIYSFVCDHLKSALLGEAQARAAKEAPESPPLRQVRIEERRCAAIGAVRPGQVDRGEERSTALVQLRSVEG